ncbi:MAG: nucleotide exchange factor GrpE [Pelovirga sp.]
MSKKNEKKTADPATAEAAETGQPDGGATVEADLEKQLATALEEKQQIHEQYLRLLAEMDNLRKRTNREKEEIAKFANEGILRDILPVIDNLERAVEHSEKTDSNEGLLEGVRMTLSQFTQVLNRFGVETIDAVGKPFDPAYHQAMGQLESADHPVNTVMVEMQKGYQLNERLLRPAFVMVAKPPSEKSQEADDDNKTT